ncbi:triple gene block 3 [Dioscorea virus A]|nr:triple gene block 3 [Dioscorea virus A]
MSLTEPLTVILSFIAVLVALLALNSLFNSNNNCIIIIDGSSVSISGCEITKEFVEILPRLKAFKH